MNADSATRITPGNALRPEDIAASDAKAPEAVVAAEKEKAAKYEALIKQLTEGEDRLTTL